MLNAWRSSSSRNSIASWLEFDDLRVQPKGRNTGIAHHCHSLSLSPPLKTQGEVFLFSYLNTSSTCCPWFRFAPSSSWDKVCKGYVVERNEMALRASNKPPHPGTPHSWYRELSPMVIQVKQGNININQHILLIIKLPKLRTRAYEFVLLALKRC